MPVVRSRFRPAWWCRNPHLQTLWPLTDKPPHPDLTRERLELADGDFLDLDWTTNGEGPVVIVLHGLEGSAHSHYARRIMHALPDHGFRGLLMHFRGRGGEPNRLPRAYHSGETGDLETLVKLLRRRQPHTPLLLIGYSLGGNVLLKWLGEQGRNTPVTAATAVSVPFVLADLADRMNHGLARLYQYHLVKSLHRSFTAKASIVDPHINIDDIRKLNTFWEFDDKVTAPIHGFADARDYYTKCSSRRFLKSIAVPTLVLHARDDPFMTPRVIPTETDLSPCVRFELSDRGGHVGFISGGSPATPDYWLEPRIIDFMKQVLTTATTVGAATSSA